MPYMLLRLSKSSHRMRFFREPNLLIRFLASLLFRRLTVCRTVAWHNFEMSSWRLRGIFSLSFLQSYVNFILCTKNPPSATPYKSLSALFSCIFSWTR